MPKSELIPSLFTPALFRSQKTSNSLEKPKSKFPTLQITNNQVYFLHVSRHTTVSLCQKKFNFTVLPRWHTFYISIETYIYNSTFQQMHTSKMSVETYLLHVIWHTELHTIQQTYYILYTIQQTCFLHFSRHTSKNSVGILSTIQQTYFIQFSRHTLYNSVDILATFQLTYFLQFIRHMYFLQFRRQTSYNSVDILPTFRQTLDILSTVSVQFSWHTFYISLCIQIHFLQYMSVDKLILFTCQQTYCTSKSQKTYFLHVNRHTSYLLPDILL